MLLYQLLILVALLVFCGIIADNLACFRSLPPTPTEAAGAAALPELSVLVPARDEARNISGCVTSLLAQDYPGMEVIVLDDNSTDQTHAILERLAAGPGGERLRILCGAPLPEGWHGKAWACQQLARAASGHYLLFTDADTRHLPGSLMRAAAAMRASGADMLSLTPAQEFGSFWEGLIVPLVYHILFSYLPIRLVGSCPSPAFCYAIGQFIMFRREAYLAIGGHQSVSDNIVEDVGLCKAVKRAGGRVAAFDGTDAVRCRMYGDGQEVWNGFSKNLFAGFGNNGLLLMFLLLLLVLLYLAPWGFVAAALARGDRSFSGWWLPLAQVMLAIGSRLVVSHRFRQPLWPAILHAPSQVVLLVIALNSFRQTVFGNGPVWKGRSYGFARHGGG